MNINAYILIITALIWIIIEGGLILRDRFNAKGTTRIDRMTRLFNTISIVIAIDSPVLSILFPMLRFGSAESLIIILTGTLLICLGFFLRYWSIIILGRYFRTTVEIEKGQKVIQKGPYRFIRHPSYSGIILFFIGYGLVSQNWLSLAFSVVLPAAALLFRINVEEKAFVKEVGTEYKKYQSRTKKLIPRNMVKEIYKTVLSVCHGIMPYNSRLKIVCSAVFNINCQHRQVILDSIDNELSGAKAHSLAAMKAGLSIQELDEAFTIVTLVKGINFMCNSGDEVIKEAEKYITEKKYIMYQFT